MKNLLLAFFLLCAVAAQAQEAPAPSPTAPYRYCALVVNDNSFSGSNNMGLDYGQGVKDAPLDAEMAEMAKNIGGSRSTIDALNYLSRHGWEYVNVTNVPSRFSASGVSGSGYITSETRYLLRRRSHQ